MRKLILIAALMAMSNAACAGLTPTVNAPDDIWSNDPCSGRYTLNGKPVTPNAMNCIDGHAMHLGSFITKEGTCEVYKYSYVDHGFSLKCLVK